MLSSPVFHWGQNFLNKLDLTNNKKILEIGCRQGKLSKYLAEQYQQSQFTAIDNMRDEISQAKIYSPHPNLTFETIDAYQLGYTEHFDAVVSFSCLHWIQDKGTVLQNIYQALKPGGKAFLQFFALHGRLKNDRFLYQISQKAKWKSYFKNFIPDYAEVTASQFCALLQNIGFVVHKIEFDQYKTDFDHPDALHQWFGTWASHKNRLPIRTQDHFLNETVKLYLNAHQYTENNSFSYGEYVLEVVCEKPLLPVSIESQYQFANIIFTKHEASVLKHYLLGKTAKEIALLKLVSPKTIEFHLANIKQKIDCYRRSEIYQAAFSYGFNRLIYDPTL